MQTQPTTENTPNTIPVDTLVHLGAGQCSELDEYLALSPRQLLLVEADSQLAKELETRIQGLTNAQVCCAAIAGKPGDAIWYRYNFPELNSLCPASGLMEIFPGLKLVEAQQVETISPVTLLEPLQLEAEKENRLVVDLPGEELPVLQALQQSQRLEVFSRISLYCGSESLYEGSETAGRILDWLQEVGFDLDAKDDSRDPDRPCWSFRRNALQSRNRILRRQLDQALVKNEELTKHVTGLQAESEKLTQDFHTQSKIVGECETKINELTKQSNELKTQQEQQITAQEQQAKLVVDLNIQLEQLNQAKTEAEKLAADTKSKLDATSKARDEQTKLVVDLQAQVKQLTQDRDTQSKLAGEREAQINELTKQVDDKKNQLDQLLKKQEQQANLFADLNVQLKQVNQAKTEAEKLAADRKNKLEISSKALDEQTKLVADLQTRAIQLTQDRDTQIKLAGERETKVNELTKQVNDKKTQLDQLAKEKEQQTKLVADLNVQLEQVNQAKLKAEQIAADTKSNLNPPAKLAMSRQNWSPISRRRLNN